MTPTASRASRSRSRERAIAKAKSATRWPQVLGSPWMPWVRPTRSVSRCSSAWSRSAATSRSALLEHDVGRVGQLQRERGVEQVRAGHAEVHVGGGLARLGVVGPGAQERDHVVLGDRLDLGDRLRGRRRGVAYRLDRSLRGSPRRPRAPRPRGSRPCTTARTCGPRSRPAPSRAGCTARSQTCPSRQEYGNHHPVRRAWVDSSILTGGRSSRGSP